MSCRKLLHKPSHWNRQTQTTQINYLVTSNKVQGIKTTKGNTKTLESQRTCFIRILSAVYTVVLTLPSMQTFFLLVTQSFRSKECVTSVTSQKNASEGGWPSLSLVENKARRKLTTIVSDPCLNIRRIKISGYIFQKVLCNSVVEHPTSAWKVRG